MNGFINEIKLNDSIFDINHISKRKNILENNIFLIENIFHKKEILNILNRVNMFKPVSVGLNGILKDYKEGDYIGSYRRSLFNENYSNIVWNRIKNLFDPVYNFNEFSCVDWDNYNTWKPIGINPLWRFIEYKKSGSLIPHYDAPYIQNDNIRSLFTIVIYLTNNKEGTTRFLKDNSINLPYNKRNYDDKEKVANKNDIIIDVEGISGNALVFPHRILHDCGQLLNENYKHIIRTDIMFEKV